MSAGAPLSARLTAFALVGLWFLPASALSQDAWQLEPEGFITSVQRSAMQQVRELVEAGQNSEALTQIGQLKDIPSGLVRSGPIQIAGTQRVQVFRTLQKWCRDQEKLIFSADPALESDHQRRWNSQAKLAHQSLMSSHDVSPLAQPYDRFQSTDWGESLAKLQFDILLEKAQGMAALPILEENFSAWTRVNLGALTSQRELLEVPWYRAWEAAESNSAVTGRLLELWNSRAREQPDLTLEVLKRQLISAAMHPNFLDLPAMITWSQVVAEHLPEPSQSQALTSLIESVKERQLTGEIENRAEFHLNQWPDQQVQLERFSNSFDLTPSTRPPVGQLEAMLPVYPAIYEDRVFVHELTQIRAYDLDPSASWPSTKNDSPLFDSKTAAAAYLPLGYPTIGGPQGRLTIDEGCLFARMGSPVTAWANRTRSSHGASISYLIGLDLDSQGKLLQGFPRHLEESELTNAEFEGCPVVSGQMLISAVTQRDKGNVRRRLVALDRYSAKLVWMSQVLGSGVVAGSQRANIISNTQPVVAAGLIYYASDLGCIACLDAKTGQIVWLSNYQAHSPLTQDYPRPNRFRYRDGNPCLVHRGLVYCMPQDCPELFALDALSGDLVWSTNEVEVADCTYLVGVTHRTIIASGDRLVWLDCLTGRPFGSFPEFTTPGLVNSLPQPRGLGHASLVADNVYWPTSGEVYVFPADLPAESESDSPLSSPPKWDKRLSTGSRGAEGCNLVAADRWLVMVAPGRMACFRSE